MCKTSPLPLGLDTTKIIFPYLRPGGLGMFVRCWLRPWWCAA